MSKFSEFKSKHRTAFGIGLGVTLGILFWIFIFTIIRCNAQEIVMVDSVLIVGEPVEWVDIYDIETNTLLDSVPYLDNAYEFYARNIIFDGEEVIADTNNIILGVMSGDDMKIEMDVRLDSLGKGKYEFGYRPISLDGSSISPNIFWASMNINNKWYLNYIPKQFIIKRIRSGHFIGIVIYN